MSESEREPVRICLVEDNPGDSALIREYLRDAPRFEIECFSSLNEALEALGTNRFDIALLDLNLPDASGLEGLERMHRELPRLPIVVLTGLGDDRLSLEALRRGAQDYLEKGHINPDLLIRAIRYGLERKRGEDALHESEARLRAAQRMEAMGQLAGGVAHDFNNLLTVIAGYSELILERIGDGSAIAPDVERILSTVERGATLTRQLLAFGRRQELEPKVLDLGDLITEIGQLAGRTVAAEIEMELTLAPDLGRVRADPVQVEQVLLNLVVNARDAMPEGGRLTIDTRNVDLEGPELPVLEEVSPGPYVKITVTDTGHGMSATTQALIFEPFFTTKPEGKGTGLGLATAYGIVRQSGGHIWVSSRLGFGTTFEIVLPRVARRQRRSRKLNQ